MLIISKKLLFLFFSVVAFGHYSLAMEDDSKPLTRTEHNNAIPLRQLDLTGYENLDSAKLISTKDGAYGFQNPHYGVLEQKIFNDVQSFSLTQEDRWVYLEVGAGYGLFPLRVYEHTHNPAQACFIVNDLIPDQLSGLLKLMFTPNEKNKGLLSSFKIVSGDCLAAFERAEFKNNVPNGVDFISCLNCGHFFSPYKFLMFFARVSEILKGGGKFYFLHDSFKEDVEAVKLVESLSFTKEYYNSLSESERQLANQRQVALLLKHPITKIGILHARNSFIINRLKERNLHYPTFVNKSIMEKFMKVGTDQFYPPIDFIKEIAEVVRLNLIETGARFVKEGGIPTEIGDNPEEANSLWYIFEKDRTSSLGGSDEESFRNSERFKQLFLETKQADEERTTVEFKSAPWYPFAEEIWSPFKGQVAALVSNERGDVEKVPVKKTIDPATQKKAEDLFKSAQGLFDQGKQIEGIQCLKEAATLGYVNAQCDLGVIYFKGTGVQKDEEEGLKWFKEAADQDYVKAQFNFGFAMLQRGNKEVAYEYLKKAADQGHANARLIIQGDSFMVA